MQLNTFTDYSLRVLIYAAVRREQRCMAAEAAAAFGVSRHHIIKVIHTLQRLGYLETTRGRGGGFRLAQDPERIRIGDVVRHTEGTLALAECFAGDVNRCPLTPACGLKGVLHEAVDAFFGVLDRWTVADLVARRRMVALVNGLGGVA